MPSKFPRLPLPPILLLLAIAITYLTRGALPRLPLPLGYGLGVTAALAAAALLFPAAWQFGKADTTLDPARPERSTTLVTEGVHARSRNPMYIGEVLLVAAVALSMNPLIGLPAAAGFWLFLDRVQIPAEERALAARFGADYADYRARVPRWL